MKICIVKRIGRDKAKYPHAIRLLNLDEEVQRAELPAVSQVETGNREHPELKVKFAAEIRLPEERLIQNVTVVLAREPYDNHPTLNGKLIFNRLKEALADLELAGASCWSNGHGSELALRVRFREEDFEGVPVDGNTSDAAGDNDEEYFEGGLLFRLHRQIERNRTVVIQKKAGTIRAAGKLVCEVCDFNFAAVYGPLGDGFAECHHRIPLAELKKQHRIHVGELAIVCANCHRMLHRKPVHTVESLRELVQGRSCRRTR